MIILAHESDLESTYIRAAYQASQPQPPKKDFFIPEGTPDIQAHAPIGDHNINTVKGKRFSLTLKNGNQVLIEPVRLKDRFLNVIVYPEEREASYALSIVNGE